MHDDANFASPDVTSKHSAFEPRHRPPNVFERFGQLPGNWADRFNRFHVRLILVSLLVLEVAVLTDTWREVMAGSLMAVMAWGVGWCRDIWLEASIRASLEPNSFVSGDGEIGIVVRNRTGVSVIVRSVGLSPGWYFLCYGGPEFLPGMPHDEQLHPEPVFADTERRFVELPPHTEGVWLADPQVVAEIGQTQGAGCYIVIDYPRLFFGRRVIDIRLPQVIFDGLIAESQRNTSRVV